MDPNSKQFYTHQQFMTEALSTSFTISDSRSDSVGSESSKAYHWVMLKCASAIEAFDKRQTQIDLTELWQVPLRFGSGKTDGDRLDLLDLFDSERGNLSQYWFLIDMDVIQYYQYALNMGAFGKEMLRDSRLVAQCLEASTTKGLLDIVHRRFEKLPPEYQGALTLYYLILTEMFATSPLEVERLKKFLAEWESKGLKFFFKKHGQNVLLATKLLKIILARLLQAEAVPLMVTPQVLNGFLHTTNTDLKEYVTYKMREVKIKQLSDGGDGGTLLASTRSAVDQRRRVTGTCSHLDELCTVYTTLTVSQNGFNIQEKYIDRRGAAFGRGAKPDGKGKKKLCFSCGKEMGIGEGKFKGPKYCTLNKGTEADKQRIEKNREKFLNETSNGGARGGAGEKPEYERKKFRAHETGGFDPTLTGAPGKGQKNLVRFNALGVAHKWCSHCGSWSSTHDTQYHKLAMEEGARFNIADHDPTHGLAKPPCTPVGSGGGGAADAHKKTTRSEVMTAFQSQIANATSADTVHELETTRDNILKAMNLN